jgi:hypothetical protein
LLALACGYAFEVQPEVLPEVLPEVHKAVKEISKLIIKANPVCNLCVCVCRLAETSDPFAAHSVQVASQHVGKIAQNRYLAPPHLLAQYYHAQYTALGLDPPPDLLPPTQVCCLYIADSV